MKIKQLYILFIISIALCVDYNTEIQPIFNNNCATCHIPGYSGGLNLSSYENLMSTDVVIPGNYESSLLYIRIIAPETAPGDMPPTGSLLQSEIDLIASWIEEGALEFEEFTCMTGDVNEDSLLNILDVVSLINIILSESNESDCGDVNEDGLLNILDVVLLVTYVLNPDSL